MPPDPSKDAYGNPKQDPWHEDPWGAWGRFGDKVGATGRKILGMKNPMAESQSTIDRRDNLNAQGAAAGAFADQSQEEFRRQGALSQQQYDAMGDQASGKTSISREMLRQGLQQQYGQQRSMAAGASPQNAAMAARTGAMQMGRAATGMSGQAAVAGMQEQMAARDQQSRFLQNWRGQDLAATQGARGQAIGAYGAGDVDKSWMEKYGPAIAAGAAMVSDERLKKNITDGDAQAKAITDRLKTSSYSYKDPKHGAGPQLGVMAQEMERKGLGHAVIDTSAGKMVDGAKVAMSGLALTAALARRVDKLEKPKSLYDEDVEAGERMLKRADEPGKPVVTGDRIRQYSGTPPRKKGMPGFGRGAVDK